MRNVYRPNLTAAVAARSNQENAALPKRSLGSNLFVGGTPQPQSDVATGPAVPASSINRAQPAAPDTDVARPHRPPLPPIATAEAAMHQPAPAAPQRTPTLSGAARVPTMSGGAIVPPKPPVAEARPPAPSDVIEELDFDDAEVVDITSDRPPPAEISSVEVSQVVSVDEPAEASSKEPAADDLDDLHWTEPPTQDQRPPDSSPRPRAATSLDEALSGVTAESEPDIPLKTPPPESGRQPLEGVYAPSIPATTTTDLLPMPTAEQLGETVISGHPQSPHSNSIWRRPTFKRPVKIWNSSCPRGQASSSRPPRAMKCRRLRWKLGSARRNDLNS